MLIKQIKRLNKDTVFLRTPESPHTPLQALLLLFTDTYGGCLTIGINICPVSFRVLYAFKEGLMNVRRLITVNNHPFSEFHRVEGQMCASNAETGEQLAGNEDFEAPRLQVTADQLPVAALRIRALSTGQ